MECTDTFCFQRSHTCMLTAQSQMKWNSGDPVFLCGIENDCGMIVAYFSDIVYLVRKMENG